MSDPLLEVIGEYREILRATPRWRFLKRRGLHRLIDQYLKVAVSKPYSPKS